MSRLVAELTAIEKRLREHNEAVQRRNAGSEEPAANLSVSAKPSPPPMHGAPPTQVASTETNPMQRESAVHVRRRDRVFNILKDASDAYEITVKLQQVAKFALDVVADEGTVTLADGTKATGDIVNLNGDDETSEIVCDTDDDGKMDTIYTVDSDTMEEVLTPDDEEPGGIMDIITELLQWYVTICRI